MDLLEKFAPEKKKPPGINQCGEKGNGGGDYIPTGYKNSEPSVPGILKFSRIKESPQFGWVKKLQRTAGFWTI